VPFATDTKNYEDVYIHNPKLLLSRGGTAEEVKQKAQLDVNFLENVQTHPLPEGYGSFQSRSEIDVLNAVTEQGAVDVSRQQKKELEFEIQAKKIINKYNHNSSRIIQSNHLQRKVELRDEEQLLQEKHLALKMQQQQIKPKLSEAETYTEAEYLGLAHRFAQNLVHCEKEQLEIPAPEGFRQTHQELLKAVNMSIKQLKSNNDISAVKRRIPSNILDKLLYY